MMKPVALALPALFLSASASAFTLTSANVKGWEGEELVVDYNFQSCAGLSEAAMKALAEDAFDVWNRVPDSRFTIKLGNATTVTPAQAFGLGFTGVSAVIACDPAFNTTTGATASAAIVGVGGSGSTNAGGYYQKGYLLLNADASDSVNVATMSSTKTSIVIAHELGHALGFGHSGDPKALMYYSTGAKTNLALSQDDMDAMAFLYGRSEPSGGVFGCGTLTTGAAGTGGPGLGATLVAFWFLAVPALATGRPRRWLAKRA